MDIGQIISTVIITVITGIVGVVLVGYINHAINANKDQFAELLKSYKESIAKEQSETLRVLQNISIVLKELTDQINSIKIELIEKYVRKEDLEKFRHENLEAHKELRLEIREMERSA